MRPRYAGSLPARITRRLVSNEFGDGSPVHDFESADLPDVILCSAENDSPRLLTPFRSGGEFVPGNGKNRPWPSSPRLANLGRCRDAFASPDAIHANEHVRNPLNSDSTQAGCRNPRSLPAQSRPEALPEP